MLRVKLMLRADTFVAVWLDVDDTDDDGQEREERGGTPKGFGAAWGSTLV